MASDGAEVAEDYRLALEDLSSNMRFEISNLTVIARENTEHALAIAEVLQQHILKAPPSKKLPALYVMDSIVKNVGTPYTLYFGRNLFKTFMESYAVVDHGVRRKMEEMLKTWKDPVPGSLDTRPVFSHELVRPIENALMKARAASMPQQAQGPIPGRPRQNMFPHRNTPTPPGGRGYTGPGAGYPQQPPPQQQQQHQHQQQQQQQHQQHQQLLANGGQQSSIQQQMPFHPPHSATSSHSSTPVPFQPGPPGPTPGLGLGLGLGLGSGPGPYGSAGAVTPVGISVENLSNDIQNLIGALKAEFSQNPHDASVQNRLRALLDLQGVVQHTNLPPDQLELIKHKVTELAVTLRAPPPPLAHKPAYTPALLVSQTPVSHTYVAQTPPMSVAPAPPPPPVTAAPAAADSISLDSLLGKGAMAALLSMQSSMSQSAATTQPPSFGDVAIRSPPVVHAEAPKPAVLRHLLSPHPPTPSQPPPPAAAAATSTAPGAAFSILEQLRAAGILPTATPTNTAAAPTPPAHPQAVLPPAGLAGLPAGLPASIANFLAAQKKEAVVVNPIPDAASHAAIDAAALRQQFRPDAIRALYDDLGPPCTQCGRRFKTDEEGKKKKTAHMDWHFKVHQRSTEAEKRGTHRSWYVDQQDWQNAREAVDAIHDVTTKEQAAPTAKDSEAPKYIPVPDPSSNINNVCPICQEKFENKWLDTAQEWVWLDTVLVGNRAYHASCHAEATRDRESTPGVSRRTPEPVLGKRKAEGVLGSPKMRIQKMFT